MVAVAVLIEVLVLAVLDIRALDLLGRLVALRNLYPVADSAHVHLGGRRAFAGMKALGVEHDIELAVVFHDIALTQRAGNDFHGELFLDPMAAAIAAARSRMWGRTIPILAPFASDFRAALRASRSCACRCSFAQPCRPATVPAGAHADRGRPAGAFRGARIHRGRDAALTISPGNETHLHAFATDVVAPGGVRARALSAHLPGICLQEAARGGRAPHIRVRALFPQPRARCRCTIRNSR